MSDLLIRHTQLDVVDRGDWWTEASTIGIDPGTWPDKLTALFPAGYIVFDKLEEDHHKGELVLVRYVASPSGATITVFND